MAFVGDDQVKGVDGNVQSLSIVVDRLISIVKNSFLTQEIDRHSLNGTNIDKGVSGFGIQQIRGRQHFRIKLFVLV